MVIAVSLLIALVGVLMYALSANPKLSMIGLISYGAGILAFLIGLPGAHFGLLPK